MFEQSETNPLVRRRRDIDTETGNGGGIGDDKGKKAPFNWASLPVNLLIQYYDEIRQHLPETSLKDINLEEQLLLQFHVIRTLQAKALEDDEVPMQQRVQAANAGAAILKALVDMQERVYTTERYKAIENLLIRLLNKQPEEFSVAFLTEYEKVLEKYGQVA